MVLNKVKYFFLFLILFPAIAKTQHHFDFSDTAVAGRIKKDLYVLASDSLKGREAGTIYEIKARDYIVERFKEIGLLPMMPDSSFIQEFTYPDTYGYLINISRDTMSEKNKPDKSAYNVVGYIDNGAQYSVVIGAHYDHLGYIENSPSKYHGADDNASGTVGVIEIARYLKERGKKNNNYIICAFSAEEKGLYGSKYFVESKLFDSSKVNYMLDLDMIGRLGAFGTVLYANGAKSSRMWGKIIRKNKTKDFFVKKVPAGMDGSDDYPFYKKGIPVLFFITGMHKDYHTIFDVSKKINFTGEVSIIKYVESLIDKVDSIGKISYKEVSSWQTVRSNIIFAKMLLKAE